MRTVIILQPDMDDVEDMADLARDISDRIGGVRWSVETIED